MSVSVAVRAAGLRTVRSPTPTWSGSRCALGSRTHAPPRLYSVCREDGGWHISVDPCEHLASRVAQSRPPPHLSEGSRPRFGLWLISGRTGHLAELGPPSCSPSHARSSACNHFVDMFLGRRKAQSAPLERCGSWRLPSCRTGLGGAPFCEIFMRRCGAQSAPLMIASQLAIAGACMRLHFCP